jgi:DNA polymerase-3 subunit delta
MAQKSTNLCGLELLLTPQKVDPPAVCVLVGDEGFLQHEVRRTLAERILGAEDAESLEILDGRTAELRDLLDALAERSLFGGERRAVAVERADPLVKNYRERLEVYVARPTPEATLILEVESWPGNTRLAKAVAESGLVLRCQTPEQGRELTDFNRLLKEWLAAVARREHQCELASGAAELLLELLPSEPGILFQELARLALLAKADAQGVRKIDAALVRDHVGGWRTRKTWDMIDAAAAGDAAEALAQLDRLLAAGEEPHALLPQMASTLRRFAAAVRVFDQAEATGQRPSLRYALEQAGMPVFKLGDAESQLRQIGRPRARRLYRWLLAADLELKGHNSTKERARRVLETLIVRLSQAASAAALR